MGTGRYALQCGHSDEPGFNIQILKLYFCSFKAFICLLNIMLLKLPEAERSV